MRYILVFYLFLLIFFSLSVAAKPKICVVAPFTGKYAPLGHRVDAAVRFQVQRTECGLTVQDFDTKGVTDDATTAISAVSKDNDCLVAIGGVGDHTGAMVANWAGIWEMPLLLLNGQGAVESEWVTRLRPTRDALFKDIGRACAAMKKDKIFVLCPDVPDLHQMCASFQEGAASAGQKTIIPVECPGPDECAKALARLVPGRKGDFLVFTPFPLQQTIRLTAFLGFLEKRELFTVVGGPVLNVMSLLTQRAAELEGLVFGDVFVSSTMPVLDAQYRRLTGHGLSTMEIWAMDSAGLACMAYKNHHASTRDAVRDFLLQVEKFQGVSGTYIKDAAGWHEAVRLFRVHDGAIEPIGP